MIQNMAANDFPSIKFEQSLRIVMFKARENS